MFEAQTLFFFFFFSISSCWRIEFEEMCCAA
ncbi:hypothetical protein LINPERHAP2_LOCUS14853 [Linum perenne]